jgi:TolB protein
MNLGMAGFIPATPSIDEVKSIKQVNNVLRNDLVFSRYFNLVEGGLPVSGRKGEFTDWQSRGADIILSGALKIISGEMVLTVKLFDMESEEVIWQQDFKSGADGLRAAAHAVNDEVIKRLTGEPGIAHTRIVFALRKGGSKELYLVDYDGSNLRQLTDTGSLNLFPKWAPDGKEVIFTTFRYGNPDLYSILPDKGNWRAVSYKQGLNTTGAYSTDGTKIAVTLSLGHYPNIYLLDRSGKMIRQVTFGKSISTSPCFSPNGRELVFISDRPGFPQLYIMSLDGGNMRRLPARGNCDSPAWSPRGDKIAFTMRQGYGNYDLYIYDISQMNITRLTRDEGKNENPSWSPDGRFIVFGSNRSGKNELYIMAADGSGQRNLSSIAGESSMPNWGP